jgi:hypothetical protein
VNNEESTMANAATLNTPSSKTSPIDEVSFSIRDRILGALYAATRGTSRNVNLADIHERLRDVNDSDFDRVINWLDREGVIALDRGADATYAKLARGGIATESVPSQVKDRVLGAVWAVARGPMRLVHLNEVRGRIDDISQTELDRAIVALALQGEVDIGRGIEQGWVRLWPTSRTMQGTMADGFGMTMPGMTPYGMPFAHMHAMTPSVFAMPLPVVFRPLIERVARLLWESRGRQDGYDFQNWIEAEHIVRHQLCCGSGF